MVSTVNASIFVEHKEMIAREGGYVKLICNTTIEVEDCTFKSPEGQDYDMNLSHKLNRIRGLKRNDCSIMISPVKLKDNGVWSCNVG